MKLNKVLLYLAILLAVGAYLYFFEIRDKEKKQTQEEESKKIVQLEKDKITKLELVSKEHGKIELQKPADVWVMTVPVKTKADASTVGSLIHSALEAKAEKVILEENVKWEEYGLDKPEFTLTLFTQDNKKLDFLFGAANPAKTSYYFRLNDESKLLLVADTLKNSLNKSVFDLRDKTLLTIAPDDVEYLIISKESNKTEIKKEAPDRWVMVQPEVTKVKTSLITGGIKTLTGLSAKQIIDEPQKEGDPYGLEKPKEIITLGGNKLEQVLEVGKEEDKKDSSVSSYSQPNYYVRVKGYDTVYLVEGRILKNLKTDPQELKDRSVIAFNPLDIEKIDITLEGKSWVAVQEKDKKWTLEKPEKKAKMDSWPVSSILWDIKDLEWKSLIKPAPTDLASVHLDKPKLVAQLFKKDQKEPLILKAGWEDELRKEDKKQEATNSKAGEDKKTTEPQSVPPTINAIAQPQEDKDAILVLDGSFINRLRQDLERLTEKSEK